VTEAAEERVSTERPPAKLRSAILAPVAACPLGLKGMYAER